MTTCPSIILLWDIVSSIEHMLWQKRDGPRTRYLRPFGGNYHPLLDVAPSLSLSLYLSLSLHDTRTHKFRARLHNASWATRVPCYITIIGNILYTRVHLSAWSRIRYLNYTGRKCVEKFRVKWSIWLPILFFTVTIWQIYFRLWNIDFHV